MTYFNDIHLKIGGIIYCHILSLSPNHDHAVILYTQEELSIVIYYHCHPIMIVLWYSTHRRNYLLSYTIIVTQSWSCCDTLHTGGIIYCHILSLSPNHDHAVILYTQEELSIVIYYHCHPIMIMLWYSPPKKHLIYNFKYQLHKSKFSLISCHSLCKWTLYH
jgi:hypothetical protein